jgi:hypothetical protein
MPKGVILGRNTKRLSKLMPMENIQAYFHVYGVMTEVDSSRKKPASPYDRLHEIERSIDVLKGNGWYSNAKAESIKHSLHQFDPDTLSCFVSNMHLTGGAHDKAFDFLVYALLHDLEEYTGKPNYQAVQAFLREQALPEPGESALTVRYHRLKSKEHEAVMALEQYMALLDNPQDMLPDSIDGICSGFLLRIYGFWKQQRFDRELADLEEKRSNIPLPDDPVRVACNIDLYFYTEWLKSKGLTIPDEYLTEYMNQKPETVNDAIETMKHIIEARAVDQITNN